MPSPPKGHNSKFYTPWRGIYTVIARTSPLTYIVKKKGGRQRKAHVNRLKFYNPMDSKEDPLVKLSIEDDEPDTEEAVKKDNQGQQRKQHKQDEKIYQGRITRSKTNSLPHKIPRFQSSAVDGNSYNNSSHQYPWANDYLINSLKQVKIIN